MKALRLLFLFTALVPGLLFAGSNTNKGANPNGKPFVELGGQIVEIEGEISSLQDQIDALVGRVNSIEAEQTALANAIVSLGAENVSLQAQIDANTADVDALEGQISNINSQILDLQAQIDANGDADGVLQAQVGDLETQATTLALAIDTLEGDLRASIENNTDLINAMQDRIENIEYALTMKQNVINGLCSDGSSIRQVHPDGSVECEVDDVGSVTAGISVTRTERVSNIDASRNLYVRTYCYDGHTPVSAGFTKLASNIEIVQSYVNPVIQSYAFGHFFNANTYQVQIVTYATCLRVTN